MVADRAEGFTLSVAIIVLRYPQISESAADSVSLTSVRPDRL